MAHQYHLRSSDVDNVGTEGGLAGVDATWSQARAQLVEGHVEVSSNSSELMLVVDDNAALLAPVSATVIPRPLSHFSHTATDGIVETSTTTTPPTLPLATAGATPTVASSESSSPVLVEE